MSDVGFVKIISIWCLSVQFGRRSMKSFREDCNQQYSSIDSDNGVLLAKRQAIIWTNDG